MVVINVDMTAQCFHRLLVIAVDRTESGQIAVYQNDIGKFLLIAHEPFVTLARGSEEQDRIIFFEYGTAERLAQFSFRMGTVGDGDLSGTFPLVHDDIELYHEIAELRIEPGA